MKIETKMKKLKEAVCVILKTREIDEPSARFRSGIIWHSKNHV